MPRGKGGPEDLTRGPGDLARGPEDLIRGPEDILNISLDSGDSSTGHSNNGGHSLSRPTTRTTKTISSASDSSRSSTTERSGDGEHLHLRGAGRAGAGGGGGRGESGEHTYINFQPEILSCELERRGTTPSSCTFSPTDSERILTDRSASRASSRLHETHFGDSLHSLPCTVVHSPMAEGEEGEGRVHLTTPLLDTTPLSRGVGGGRMRRSVGPDGGEGGGGVREGGGPHHLMARTRVIPLGPSFPIDLMPSVHIRPNGTIFDCELGCFIPLEEYQRRRTPPNRSKEQIPEE